MILFKEPTIVPFNISAPYESSNSSHRSPNMNKEQKKQIINKENVMPAQAYIDIDNGIDGN